MRWPILHRSFSLCSIGPCNNAAPFVLLQCMELFAFPRERLKLLYALCVPTYSARIVVFVKCCGGCVCDCPCGLWQFCVALDLWSVAAGVCGRRLCLRRRTVNARMPATDIPEFP